MTLQTPIANIKGVGPVTAKKLHDAGIFTVDDLVQFLPRKYEDFSQVTPIAAIRPGKVTVKVTVENVKTRRVRRGMHVTEATLSDPTGKLSAVWFNQSYRAAQLEAQQEFFMSGEFSLQYNKYQLINPSAEKADGEHINTDRILPIYREVKGLKSHTVRALIAQLKPLITMLPETLPNDIVTQQQLISYADALLGLHFPESDEQLQRAKERFAFEELFELLLASGYNKLENNKLEGWHIPFDVQAAKEFVRQLPFKLTNAQRLAAWEIVQNFNAKVPMNRLLQGDVGSGKTVVAGFAAYMAARAGFQTAIMAPTEILATQHAATLRNLLGPLGVEVGLLIGHMPKKAKEILYEQLAGGAVEVTVGTHALLQEKVQFQKLGFVVIDEQHRFGVQQRQTLLHKSEHMPHLLAMTATPIPRSLALTVYGELDISIINERPAGRKPIKTVIWSPNSRPQLYDQIEHQLAAGRQAYVICPLIDANPDNELKSVQAEYKKLQQGPFKHRRIGLLHGQLKGDEKEAVMHAFLRRETDILVSTTVVEVGVDVPNATVILIEDADRFGLAQLHQLRGRVGRSDQQSCCYLLTSTSAKPSARLRELEKSNDGFYLAEVDLQLRGPGEIYGRAQHGQLNMRLASLGDTPLIARAQRAASFFIEKGFDLLQYKKLAAQVRHYQRLTTLN
ncbi:MAG TPA: ATP-dependent DNA helicase RecG [Verrucomicrobiae bacterium]|nr:ATP-dependent DNA helicase RecG [Verrucomicrobiae bacterium]